MHTKEYCYTVWKQFMCEAVWCTGKSKDCGAGGTWI